MALLQTSHSQRSEASYPKMSSGRIPSVEGGIQPTIFDAKADILTATAADTPARLAVGANDTVLTADSSTATGLKWAAVSAGGMTLLNAGGTSLSGASVTISNISSSYTNLYLLIKNVVHSTNNFLQLRLNGDSGNNYAYVAQQPSTSGSSTIIGSKADDRFRLAENIGTQTGALKRGQIECTITRYTDTDQIAIFSNAFSTSTGDDAFSFFVAGVYDCSAAIDSLTVKPQTGTFSDGTIYVYGVK